MATLKDSEIRTVVEGSETDTAIDKISKEAKKVNGDSKSNKFDTKLSKDKISIIAAGAAILGAGSFFSYWHFQDSKEDNSLHALPKESVPQLKSPTTFPDSTTSNTTEEVMSTKEEDKEGNEIVSPNEDIDIAIRVKDSMNFKEAFTEAREEVGIGGIFTWRGNHYNTFFREEWSTMSVADRELYLKSAGYKPFIEAIEADAYEVETEDTQHPNAEEEIKDELLDTDVETESGVAKKITFKIEGGLDAMAIDKDLDGNPDVILVLKKDGTIYGMMDGEGDQSLETYCVFDPKTESFIESGILDKPFIATMAEIENESKIREQMANEEENGDENNYEQEDDDDLQNDADVSDFQI